MKDPWPIHLTTTEEIKAQGWAAESRDSDGHLLSTTAPIEADDCTVLEWIIDCTKRGETVTFFPQAT